MKNYYLLLANRDFVKIWIAQVFAVLGDAFYRVMFLWMAYELSRSTVIAGLVVFAGTIPYLFFGLPGGVYADRWDRKRTMIIAEILRTAVVLIIPLSYAFGALQIWIIAVVAFALASIRCFYHPAMKSTVTSILRDEERSAGVSLMEATTRSMQVFGMAAGGFLIAATQAETVTLVSAALFLASIIAVALLEVPARRRHRAERSLFGEVAGSFAYLAKRPQLLWAIILFCAGLLVVVGLEKVAMPVVADHVWGRGADGFGLILAVFSLGSIAGSLILGRGELRSLPPLMAGGWALWGVAYALMASSPYPLALVFAAFAGLADAMVTVPMVLMIQTRVDDEHIGKIFSIWSTASFIGESGSALMVGFLVQSLGAVLAFQMGGFGLVLVALIGWYYVRDRAGSGSQTDLRPDEAADPVPVHNTGEI
ncbi:MFS transporter [Rhizobium leguminosarum]|nr:MFS transporter [Rhizobium leguminosarum]